MTRDLRESSLRRLANPEAIAASAAFLLAAATAIWLVRPFHLGTVGYDTASSVLYFDRILAGRHLEAFVGATPKALLTIVYGLAHAVVPDWRVVSWLAILAYAVGIGAAAALTWRVAGAAAAGFVTVGLVGSAQLITDVDLAYAVSWALICWAVAGLLVTGSRPRYALAGVVLAIGGLARFETLLVVGVAAVMLAVGALGARRRSLPLTAFRDRAPILLGLLALPLQALHDWLLTGDPLYAESVPGLGSAGARLIGVSGAIRGIADHYAAEPVLLILALVGFVVFVRRREWDLLAGVVALGPGVAAFLLFLAARRIYISDRYFAPADLALTFAAAIGLASVRVPALEGAWAVGRGAKPAVVAALLAALVAAAVVRPFGPLDHDTRVAVNINALVHRDIAAAMPVIAKAMSSASDARAWPPDGSPTASTGSRAILLAPVLTVPQLAVDLDVPLSSLTGTAGGSIRTDGTYPRPGQVVFHDVDRDGPPSAFRIFEVDRPTAAGRITLIPLQVDPERRFWVVQIAR